MMMIMVMIVITTNIITTIIEGENWWIGGERFALRIQTIRNNSAVEAEKKKSSSPGERGHLQASLHPDPPLLSSAFALIPV